MSNNNKSTLDKKIVSKDQNIEFPNIREEISHPISNEVNAQQLESEKRKNKRADIDTPVLVYDLTGQLLTKAKATTISQLGIGLIIDSKLDLQNGLEFTLEFSGSKSIPAFTIKAEVTDSHCSEGTTAASLKFTQISKLSQKYIKSYIANN